MRKSLIEVIKARRQQYEYLLQNLQASSDTLQIKFKDSTGEWKEALIDDFVPWNIESILLYDPPRPKYIPFNQQNFPWNQLFRYKDETPYTDYFRSSYKFNSQGVILSDWRFQTYQEFFENCETQQHSGGPWLPCGTEVK